MDIVKIGPIKLSQDGQRVDGVIQVGDQRYPIYFQTREAQLEPNIEAFLALGSIAGDEKKGRSDRSRWSYQPTIFGGYGKDSASIQKLETRLWSYRNSKCPGSAKSTNSEGEEGCLFLSRIGFVLFISCPYGRNICFHPPGWIRYPAE